MSNLPYNVLVDLIDVYWDDPVAFAEDILEFSPDEWQRNVLSDLASSRFVSVRSGQGVGKTGLEAISVIWYLCCRPNPKVICTAPTRQQLNDVLWAEIAKWLESSVVKNFLKWTKTKVYMIGSEERWFATARTATKPENMQGFHEDYMLFVVDEASGVADNIMEAIFGTLSGVENKLLMCGNPTRTSGFFYDSHHKDRADYKTHKVSSYDSPRASKENIERLIRKYGKDSDAVRVRVYGGFPKSEPDVFIPLEMAETATETIVEPIERVLYIGADIARYGDDETVIAPRIGGKVFDLRGYNKQSTTKTTGRIIQTAREFIAEYPQIHEIVIRIDDDGVGGGVTDELMEFTRTESFPVPIRVVPMGNGRVAEDNEHYDNRGTEMWAAIRDLLQANISAYLQGTQAEIQLPKDEKLISQLTTRKYHMTSKGKVKLERKEDMKKRGLQSPDRADALALAFAPEKEMQWATERPTGW
ncbi:DEAD/DEAH box helicase family protein [Robertmurraya sp. DFI.2.37]|uniref:DEAD/DEAH box helicase family protein n=1 Tax=Robertmurraya sp. DFI.2.37 TaxID=3031819 RepID=UPI001245C662|nr:DEAD/DEAH box helicase family protein [Robertmurraya sp. DFI.2.37]MDF1510584.1 DEAD/DEAH box helicase family protein [Robertmurraya sp. DFI.2.37]